MLDEQVYQGFSFNPDHTKYLPYSKIFLQEMSKTAVGVSLRDTSLTSKLVDDIIKPKFYDTIGDFEALELSQA